MSNEFMLHLHKRLAEKTYGEPPRQLSDTTANAYIRTLTILNNKLPFKNLTFLKKTDEILKKLATYAETTQKTLLASITSVLALDKDKAGYKKAYKFYHDKMMDKAKTVKVEGGSIVANEKQTENWLTWDNVLKKHSELKTSCDAFANEKTLNADHLNTLLSHLILSLYVDLPPRRNQDYLNMVVYKALKKDNVDELPKDKNYLIVVKGVPTSFIFNVYKTAKTYGKQTIPIPDTLKDTLTTYIKRMGHKDKEHKLLPMEQDNAITRLLNKVFGKKIGSSMLRHIYLSSKYDINEMTNDATQMGHSLDEQKAYMKTPPTEPPSNDVIQELLVEAI